jgi:hypothetical protein
LKANWKVIKDAFQEVYHISTLHRRTVGNVFASKPNAYSHTLDFTLFPRHGRISLFGNADRQPTAVESLAQRFGAMLIKQDFSLEKIPKGVNPTCDPSWSVDGNIPFPNCLMYVSEGTYLTQPSGRWQKIGPCGESGYITPRQPPLLSGSARNTAKSSSVTC